MNQLHFPWLELVLACLAGTAAWSARARAPEVARRRAIVASALALVIATAAWSDLLFMGVPAAADGLGLLESAIGRSPFEIDTFSGPLLPLTALIYFVTTLTTLPTKVRRFSFARTLVSEALALAVFSCRQPSVLVVILTAAAIPPALELRSRHRSIRIYVVHQAVFALFLASGWLLADPDSPDQSVSRIGFALVAFAIAVRSGLVPVHCWITDLFENGAFGTTLLTTVPLGGAYAAARFLSPFAPSEVLRAFAFAALLTAIYAAAMSLIQTSARRFFCFAFLSHSSLVLGGMALDTPPSVTAALYLWLAVALSFTGLGLVLRSLESRTGRLSLKEFQGLSSQTPILAAFFLIAGLAAVGFPGTIGFFGIDMLVESASQESPAMAVTVVVAAAINGIAVLRVYGILFTGTRHPGTVNLRCRGSERVAILTLLVFVLGGSVHPQPAVRSRAHAARTLVDARNANRGPAREHDESSRTRAKAGDH